MCGGGCAPPSSRFEVLGYALDAVVGYKDLRAKPGPGAEPRGNRADVGGAAVGQRHLRTSLGKAGSPRLSIV